MSTVSMMNGMRRGIALALAFFLSMLPPAAFAAAEEGDVLDPTEREGGYSAVLYDNSSGLPTSEANDIAETEDGFLWIGSYSGLIRYDGNTFERLDSTSGLASVVCLFVDSGDRLWVGTNDSGVALIGKNMYRMYRKADGLPSLTVRSIVEDGQGRIYIGTTMGMVTVNSALEIEPLDIPEINDEYIRMVKRGADNVIYGVTKDGDVFTLRDGALTGFYSCDELGISDVRAVLPDREKPGWVYIGGSGAELYHGELAAGFRDAEPEYVMGVSFVNNICYVGGEIWVCADDGMGFLRDGEFRLLTGVPVTTSVENVIADYQGNLWFASSQQGVMKIVPDQFEDLFDRYHLDREVVYSTCLYDGKLFIGTKDHGLLALRDGYTIDELPLKSAASASGEPLAYVDLLSTLNGIKIRSLFRDSQNRLWICTFGETALLRYDGENLVRFSEADGLPSNRVRMICERKDGAFLAACTGGAALIDGDRVTRVYGEDDGISNTEILTIAERDNGDVFLGTDGGGIYVLRADGMEHYDTDSGLYSDVVMRLKKDRTRDLFWIVTSNSLAYITGDGRITAVRKFPYSNNFDLYENSRGEMWILSSNGIYVTTAEELLANGEVSPVYYNRDNGLSCITTANSYSELTADGDLYISGTTGVVRVNIERFSQSDSYVKMSVPYVELDGVRTYADEDGTIYVPAGVNRLTIYAYVFTYSLNNPEITYVLLGLDQEPTTVLRSNLTPITYTNLKGGSYRFVMAIEDSAGVADNTVSFSIEKQKALRETIWYQMMLLSLGVLAVAAVIQYRYYRKNQALMKKHEENKTFIREMTEAFAKTIDMKDEYTNGHSFRVAKYTAMLAKELGYDEEETEKYYNIALLHDIGKIGIPPEVLNKKEALNEEEYRIMQSHASLGYDVLKDISIMPELAIGAGMHHERPDGRGYPHGLKAGEIPRVAQIIAVADTFDAMYSTRPYRKRMNFDTVVSIIKKGSGTQLTPDVVDAFLRLAEKGELRDPEDKGGGSTKEVDNIEKMGGHSGEK